MCASEGGQGLHRLARLLLRDANLIEALQVQPELRRGAAEMRQAQGGVAGDGATSVEDLGNAAYVVPGGLPFQMNAFPPLKRWAFL